MTNQETDRGRQPYTFDRVVRIVFIAIVAVGVFWLIKILKGVLLPFLIAWLIAYLLEPFVQYNKRLLRVRKRWLPIVMTLFESCLLLCAVSIFIVPSIVEQAHQVAVFIGRYTSDGIQIPFIPEQFHRFLQDNIDFESIAAHLTREDIDSIMGALGSVVSGGYNIALWIVDLFFILLYVVFIMLDYERLGKGFRHLVLPKYRERVFAIGADVKNSMNHYFRGQALVASIVGILFCIGFAIVGLPLAIVMGLFIGLLNMVPYMQLISLLPTSLLCLVSSVDGNIDFWPLWCSCMAVYIIVQCIQDLFLTPKIMGKEMGLNPAIILLSLSVWGTLLGFIGLIIALPLTTLLLSYYDRYIDSRNDGETPAEHHADAEALRKMEEEP